MLLTEKPTQSSNINPPAPLPGSQARALLERDAAAVAPVTGREYPFVMARGRGAEVWDVDGNRFLDGSAGIAVTATGHSHPEVVAAIKAAADDFLHISGDFYHERHIQLSERLAALAPFAEAGMVFMTNSGTESVEGALKLARFATGRPRYIGFLGGFHGRTMGALSFTASKSTQQAGFFPSMPGVTHVPYPNPYRPLLQGDDQGQAVVDYIEQVLFAANVPPQEVAAVLVEPIQGEGGYLVPPSSFFPALRALCDRHGILLIVDEVQSGIGRTGKMFAIEHEGVEPDIVCSAKGLGSGMPIGAVIARRSIMENWPAGAHGNTYGGNPVCAAAALATIDLVENEYMQNAAAIGKFLLAGLRDLQRRHSLIGQVRGRGLMIGLELVSDPAAKTPAPEAAAALVQQCFQNGLLTLPCGRNSLRLSPPLLLSQTQAEEMLQIIDQSLREVAA